VSRSAAATYLLLVLILSSAFLLRFIHLDADPSALISRDFITDEGWWAHNARNEYFYGHWRIDDHNPGIYSAFLYNGFVLGAFRLLGAGLWAVRLTPALAGWLTVLVLFLLVRREVNVRAALFAAALLGFSNLHIMYSRAGFVESAIAFFLALALWSWSLKDWHDLFAMAAGVCFVMMVITKITGIYFLPGVFLVAIAGAVRRSISRRHAFLFAAGVVLASALYSGFVVAPSFRDWLHFNLVNGSGSEWPTGLVPVAGAVLRLLGSSFYTKEPLIAALALVALCSLAVGAASLGLKETIRRASELEITAAALLIGYLAMLAVTVYQAERRFIPVLFLLVILSAVVLERGWGLLAELADPNHQMAAAGWFTVLFLLPAVGILEIRPGMVGSIGLGWTWALKALCLAGLALLAHALSRRRWPYRFRRPMIMASGLIFTTLFFFLLVAIVVRALALWGFGAIAWKSAPRDLRSLAVALTTVGAFIGLLVGFLKAGPRWRAWLLAAFVCTEAVQISTWLFQPTYSVRETNASLAGLLGPGDTVVTFYETLMVSSAARVIVKSPRRRLNLDVYDRFKPQFTLVLRRDNWKDYELADIPSEEWPPPHDLSGTLIARYDLCPARLRGPRFIAEFYRLDEQAATTNLRGDDGSSGHEDYSSARTAIGSNRDASARRNDRRSQPQ
jgi:4-amino-4-deoxy-L-arabinose transferase-like glycosyltransferase